MIRSLIIFALVAVTVSAAGAAALQPPRADIVPVSVNYFGTTIVDPYRWMEAGPTDPKFAAFMHAENDYTKAMLAPLASQREKLLARIQQLNNAAPAFSSWQRAGGRLFYLEIDPGQTTASLRVREPSGATRTLFDPKDYESGGGHVAIDYYAASENGAYAAVGASQGGSENSTIRVIDVATGKALSEAITRTQYAGLSWRDDNRSFYYARLQALPPGAPPTAIYENERTYLHVLGTDADHDPVVFGAGVSPVVDVPKAGFTGVSATPGSPYVIAFYSAGTTDSGSIFVASASAANGPSTAWKKVTTPDDGVATVDASAAQRGATLYLVMQKGAPNRKVVAVDLAQPDIANARTVVPESDTVIEGIYAAKDALYITTRHGVNGSIERIAYDDGATAQPLTLPYGGAVYGVDANPTLPGILVGIDSWVVSPTLFAFDGARFTDTTLIPKNPADFSNIEAREVIAPSTDGATVPISIIMRKDLVLDGSHATWYEGYGAYGISADPNFSPSRLAWLERGGIIAFAHVRGGGEFGEAWHDAGRKATKQHTIDDMIATARYLIDNKYTSPQRLAVRGTSAGGISVGGSIVQHPELFAAAVDNVGMTALLRFQTTQGGPANVPEFGDVTTQEGFNYLYAISPYDHVVNGTKYPAVLGITGINDPRVPSWIIGEMIARLQAASNSGKPILLRVDYDAGHGLGSSRAQIEQLRADEWTFLLWQLGDPEFQPAH
jgi:prolyl oligopeptidase